MFHFHFRLVVIVTFRTDTIRFSSTSTSALLFMISLLSCHSTCTAYIRKLYLLACLLAITSIYLLYYVSVCCRTKMYIGIINVFLKTNNHHQHHHQHNVRSMKTLQSGSFYALRGSAQPISHVSKEIRNNIVCITLNLNHLKHLTRSSISSSIRKWKLSEAQNIFPNYDAVILFSILFLCVCFL